LIEILDYLDVDSVRVVRKLKMQIRLEGNAGDVRQVEPIPEAPPQEIEDVLSKIVQDVNKRWGVDFGVGQQKTLGAMTEELSSDEELQNVVTNNTKQNASVHFGGVFTEKVDDQFESDRKLWEQLTENSELKKYIEKKMFDLVAQKIFDLRE